MLIDPFSRSLSIQGMFALYGAKSASIPFPGSLFAGGYVGALLDINDFALLYTTDTGSTHVSAVSDQIGRAETKSGGTVNALQATASLRPILGQWPPGGRYHIYHDRVDDKLTLAGMPAGTYTIGTASFSGVQVYENVYSAGTLTIPGVDFTVLFIINRSLTPTEKIELTAYLATKTPTIDATDVFRGYCFSPNLNLTVVESGGAGLTWYIGDGQTASGTTCVKTITPPQYVILRATDRTKITRLDFDTSSLYGQLISSGLTGLADLFIYNNNFTGNIDLTKFPAAVKIRIYSNSMRGKLDFSACPSVDDIRVYSNLFTGTINVGSNPVLTYAHFSDNLFDSFSGSVSHSIGYFYAQNNLLTASAMNAILAAFVAAGRTSADGTFLVNVGGTGNAAPTGQGLYDKDTLLTRGCALTTN